MLVVAALYGVTLALLPLRGFWVVDAGNKLLQVQAALASGYRSLALPWPGQALDPGFQLGPIPPPFAVVQDGKLYSVFPPPFALFSSVPFRVLGYPGLYFLPLLGGLLTLVGVARLGVWLGLSERARVGAVLLAGLGTPLWFYSVQFWEHAPAVAAAIWALVLVLEAPERPERLAMGAGLAGVAVWLREDMGLFLPVVLLVGQQRLPPGDRLRAQGLFLGTAAMALAPMVAANLAYTGSPVGFHVSSQTPGGHSTAAHLLARPEVLYRLFAIQHEREWVSALLILPYLAALAVPAEGPRARGLVAVLLGAATLGWLATLPAFLGPDGPLAHLLSANSLFAGAPVLLPALVRRRGDTDRDLRRRLLQAACAWFALLYAGTLPELMRAPLNWGCRFLLVLYPLLALLAVEAVDTVDTVDAPSAGLRRAVLAAAVVSLTSQVYSLDLLHRAASWSQRVNDAIAARPERAVIALHWALPMDLHAVFTEKAIFRVQTDAELAELRRRLVESGYDRALVVARLTYPIPPGSESQWTVVPDEGLRLRAVRYTSIRLRP